MTFSLSTKQAFNLVKFCGEISCTWPKPPSSQLRVVIVTFRWWLLIGNILALLLSLAFAVYIFRANLTIATQAISEFGAAFEVLCNLFFCRTHAIRLQKALYEIETFIGVATHEEKMTIKKYTMRHKYLSAFICLSYGATAVMFISFPFFTDNELPADGWYPFATDTFVIKSLLYISQSIVILQSGLSISVDFMIASLLWYCTVKLELLAEELSQINDNQCLKNCIKKHQHLTLYAASVNKIVRFMILKANAAMGIAVVFGGFLLIRHAPMMVTMRFITFTLAGCLKLFVTARPSDDLKTTSQNISMAVYFSNWVDNSKEVKKNLLILMKRSYKPFVIYVSGFIREISLLQYADVCDLLTLQTRTMINNQN